MPGANADSAGAEKGVAGVYRVPGWGTPNPSAAGGPSPTSQHPSVQRPSVSCPQAASHHTGPLRQGSAGSERGSSPSEIIQAGAERMAGAGEEKDEEAWRITRGWGRAGREGGGGGPGGGDGADMRVGVACPSAAGTCGRGAPWASADTGMECSTAPLAWELSNPGRSGRGPGTTHHGVGSQSACRVWSWEEGAVSCSPNGMLPASSSEGPGDTNPRHEPQYSLEARRVRSISPLPSHENPGPESRSPPHDSPSSRPGNLPENPITAPPTRRNPAKRADSSKLTGRGSASRWRQGCVRSEKWRGVAVHSSRLGPKAGPVRGLGVTENRNHAAKRNLHRSRRECALKVPGKKKKKRCLLHVRQKLGP